MMCAHQPTYQAYSPEGQPFDARLHAGFFKTLPNNPTHIKVMAQQCCPPQHVDSELRNLLDWYGEYINAPDVYHPIVVAAWLHHRFVQIHPFSDGNGRVARALGTWHLVQHDYLPIVVTRHSRSAYHFALEISDIGKLEALVSFTARQHHISALHATMT